MQSFRVAMERIILDRLNEYMRPLGFKLLRGRRAFVRPFPLGLHIISFSTVTHPGIDVDFVVSVGVRHDAVEQYVSTAVPDDLRKTIPTVLQDLGILVSGQYSGRWTVAEPHDTVAACEEIIKALETAGFPYMERYSSIEEVLKVCLEDDHKFSNAQQAARALINNCPMDLPRAKKAVTILFLLNRREEFEEWVVRKREILTRRNRLHPVVGEFDALVAQLREEWDKR